MAAQPRDARDTATTSAGNGLDLTWQSGLRAVFTAASLVGAFSFCLPAVDPAYAAPDAPRVDEGALQTTDGAPNVEGTTTPATEHIDVAPKTAVVTGSPETPVETPPQIPAEEAFTRLSLDLTPPRFLAGGLGGWNGYALQAPPRSRSSAWRSRAEAFVPDWQAPVVRDLSLFVANDDEALSWSFSRASPNYGRVSYQEERVELGKLAAGVAIAVDDMQLALAYVEREQPSQLGYTAHEDYAGLIWTFRR